MNSSSEDNIQHLPSTSRANTSGNLVFSTLCDYDSTSSSEKEGEEAKEDEKRPRKSPKKRRQLKRAVGGTVGICSEETIVQMTRETLIHKSENFDWFGQLSKAIESIYPGLSSSLSIDNEKSQQGSTDFNETDYEVDLNTLELTKVLKRRKANNLPVADNTALPQEDKVDCLTTEASSSSADEFQVPKLRNRKFIFKPFQRDPLDGRLSHDESKVPVDVVIPEQLAASYGLYIWPCAPVLAWYVWLHQDDIFNKEVLELGSGTALPGLLCSKIGAKKVWLSDEAEQPDTLKNINEAVRLNDLQEKVEVIGLTWGDYTEELFQLTHGTLDFIIGSDLYFDPEVFEPLTETISFLLKNNPKANVLLAVQERSSDWSIEEWLIKYNLKCDYIFPKQFLQGTGIEESDLTGVHTIFILRLFLA